MKIGQLLPSGQQCWLRRPYLLRWKCALRSRLGWGRVQSLCCPPYNPDSPLYLLCCSPTPHPLLPTSLFLLSQMLPTATRVHGSEFHSISLQGQSSTTASHALWGAIVLQGLTAPGLALQEPSETAAGLESWRMPAMPCWHLQCPAWPDWLPSLWELCFLSP